MVVAAGILCIMIGVVHSGLGREDKAVASFRRVFFEYAELLLFLIVAMSYVNALDERHVFHVLRARLIRSGLSYRTLFWLTGTLAFLITHYPQPSGHKTGTYSCLCGLERWRATRCNFKRGSARPSLLFFTEQRISAERR